MKKNKKILICSNTDWSLLNYRANLIRMSLNNNYEVYTLSKETGYFEELSELGVKHYNVFLNQKSKNIFIEFLTFLHFFYRIISIKPDYIFSFTIKPNLYIGIIKLISFRKFFFIPNITGLGGEFQNERKSGMLILMYRIAFMGANHVFTQNFEDQNFLKKNNITKDKRCSRLNGSGIQINKYKNVRERNEFYPNGILRVSFISRLLKSKGILELIKAVKSFPDEIQLNIAGGFDSPKNIDSLLKNELDKIIEDCPNIRFLGFVEDVKELLINTDIVCLPSLYNEGVPRCLLEGLASGKIILTTDHKGCKETVFHKKNGYLLKNNSYNEIVKGLKYLLRNKAKFGQFSETSLYLAKNKFDEKQVLDRYQAFIR